MDEDAREVRRGGELIELTATEFELLRFLMRNPRRVLSKAQILDRVWNYDFGGQAHVVELYISYLRKKIDAGRRAADPHRARRRLRAETGKLMAQDASSSTARATARLPHASGRRRFRDRAGVLAGQACRPWTSLIRGSLTVRLVAGLVLLVIVTCAVLGIATYTVLSRQLTANFDQQLQAATQRAFAACIGDGPRPDGSTPADQDPACRRLARLRPLHPGAVGGTFDAWITTAAACSARPSSTAAPT